MPTTRRTAQKPATGGDQTNAETTAATDVTTPTPEPVQLEQPDVGSLKTADATNLPVGNDEADPHDPPLRSTRPDVPVLDTLAVGAGQHVPPDPDYYEPDGRPKQPEDGWDTATPEPDTND
jgi:hypothetical protein